jgi:RNA polymerase sigma-70 factor (ECF subfamily)
VTPDPAELCARHGAAVLRRCRLMLRDPHRAEDAAQEVFVRVLAQGGSFRGDAAVTTWLYQVTTRVCLNLLRAEGRRRVREDAQAAQAPEAAPGADPYEAYAARALLERLAARCDDLSLAVFVHKELDGMSQEEIAEVTGRSRKTVGRRLAALEPVLAALRAEP